MFCSLSTMDILVLVGIPTISSTIVALVVNAIWSRSKKRHNDETLIKQGVQALLRNSLYEVYTEWYPKGHCPYAVKGNFSNMYEKYHSLGKNGVLTQMHEEFMKLPITDSIADTDKKDENKED